MFVNWLHTCTQHSAVGRAAHRRGGAKCLAPALATTHRRKTPTQAAERRAGHRGRGPGLGRWSGCDVFCVYEPAVRPHIPALKRIAHASASETTQTHLEPASTNLLATLAYAGRAGSAASRCSSVPCAELRAPHSRSSTSASSPASLPRCMAAIYRSRVKQLPAALWRGSS